jgi:ATP-binding protein involved in chromosome partitioning
MPLKNQIIRILKTIVDPLSKVDIVTKGIVQGLKVSTEGQVSFILDINAEFMNEGLALKEKAELLLSELPEITSVHIAITAQRQQHAQSASKQGIPGIGHIIAVASGKGGVGKSTTAVNLACGLQSLGLKVGILDADVYGPSIPRLLGVNQKPTSDDGKTMNPIQAHGLKCMSMGFMMDETTAAIWRGPMVQSAFNQMLRQVNWGELDVLVIDLPPGTGDVQLTLAQTVLLSGAIIVSTPQDLALIDARRGLEMFVKVNIPVLGLIENMSYFLCPHCNARCDIFEHGGVRKQAQSMGIPLLSEVPLHMSIREASEKGTPIVNQAPSSSEALIYKDLAQTVWNRLTTLSI